MRRVFHKLQKRQTFVVNSEQQAKAVAALAMAYQQSPNAIGDFVRSQDSIANQTRILQNNFQTLYSTIGGDLSSSYQGALQFSNHLLTSYNNLTPASRQLLNTTLALGGAFAVLGKTGMFTSANNVLGSIGGVFSGGGFSGVKEKAEADLVVATENKKRAEIAKTDAFRESRAAAQSLRVAKLAVQEQQAAVTTAKVQMQSAEASGDAAQILTAKKNLAVATQSLTKAQLAESTATKQLALKHDIARTACMQHAVAEKACEVATNINTKASTAAGRAKIALAEGYVKARSAATAFATAIGPLGAAMIALSGVYMAFQYITEKNRNEMEGQVELAKKNTQASKEVAEAHAKERSEATAQLSRLQELSKYERMNNSEKAEAERLIDLLTKKYGDLGISIDGVTGKLNIGADAWERMNEAQRKEAAMDLAKKLGSAQQETSAMLNALSDEFGSWIEKSVFGKASTGIAKSLSSTLRGLGLNVNDEESIDRAAMSSRGRELSDILKLKTEEEQIAGLERMRNSMLEQREITQAQSVDAIIKKLKEQKKLQEEFNAAIEASKNKNDGATPGPSTPDEARKQSEAERRAMSALSSLEWDIKFDTADVENKARMLSEKVQEIFSKQSGKYGDLASFKDADRNAMTEQELQDLQEIIRLEEQRRQIQETSANAFDAERSSYEKYLADRKKSEQDRDLERKIREAQTSGDHAGANQIMQDQLRKAQEAARNMQQQYEQAVMDAQEDKIMTEEERRRISDIRGKMQEALSDQDKWKNRVDNIESTEREQRSSEKNVGAWSAAVLAAILGGTSKPEEETAKNTKEMVRLQRDILKNTVRSESGITYS